MMLQERLLIRTWSCTSPRGLTCLNRLGDLAARGTLIGPYLFCQDLGLSWKSTSSRAGCVYASYRGLEKHLSDRSLWADCPSVGRKPQNIGRSFAGGTLEQKPNVFVPFGLVLYRSGFFRRHRVLTMRIRLIAVTWPHDMIRRELSSNRACPMQGGPTGYFISEHVHVCEMFEKSRTRERARPGSAQTCPFRTVQPFSQKPRTPTVAPLLQFGLCDCRQADL